MNDKQISEHLDWLYEKLSTNPEVYLLQDIIGRDKDYSSKDIHEWGKRDAHRLAYGKLIDLQTARIYRAVENGILDKVLASEILKRESRYAEDDEVKGVSGRRELIVRFV